MSQRMQSFVLDSTLNPFNVVEPGKRPRVTLTPTLALKDGKPFLCFSVQCGDTQDQNLLQFFLNVVEFGPSVYGITQAAERYFGRKPGELNLAECLFLSSLLPSPIKYSKLADKVAAEAGLTKAQRDATEEVLRSRGSLGLTREQMLALAPPARRRRLQAAWKWIERNNALLAKLLKKP